MAKVNRRKSSRQTGIARRKGIISKLWLAIILILLVLSPFYYGKLISLVRSTAIWVVNVFHADNYPHYISYQIRIPKGYSIHGIDVSRYQGEIDWQRVAAMTDEDVKINYTIIKATEGLLSVDPYFKRNWRLSRKAGLKRGAYHYFKQNRSGLWQARFFLQTVPFSSGDIVPVIDVEERGSKSREEFQANLKQFLKEVEKQLGIKPMIYSGLKFYCDNLSGDFDDYPVWIAHYYQPRLNLASWHFWQHSDKARVNGIFHQVDMNVFNGTDDDFKKLLIK
ncbi:MAG: GH25 family lysozyme [Daejeonella sp.]